MYYIFDNEIDHLLVIFSAIHESFKMMTKNILKSRKKRVFVSVRITYWTIIDHFSNSKLKFRKDLQTNEKIYVKDDGDSLVFLWEILKCLKNKVLEFFKMNMLFISIFLLISFRIRKEEICLTKQKNSKKKSERNFVSESVSFFFSNKSTLQIIFFCSLISKYC